jgi:16S rRNA (guanine(1405)-N(7))-methyltransferase
MDDLLDELVASVRSAKRYQAIDEGLIRQVGKVELAKNRKLKEAIKTTRSKLHQVAGAYQETPIPYSQLTETLEKLPHDMQDPDLLAFCRQTMRLHASTAERLPILADFFKQVLTPLTPIHSILDLACGLTPLARPWMPLEPDVHYYACDIYNDMIAFIDQFFAHIHQSGQAQICNLTQSCPDIPVDVALLLKSVPCLEQLDKQLVPRLLAQIPAHYVVVSFPGHSLGGHQKGMSQFYANHFEDILKDTPYQVQSLTFSSEIVYTIDKSRA